MRPSSVTWERHCPPCDHPFLCPSPGRPESLGSTAKGSGTAGETQEGALHTAARPLPASLLIWGGDGATCATLTCTFKFLTTQVCARHSAGCPPALVRSLAGLHTTVIHFYTLGRLGLTGLFSAVSVLFKHQFANIRNKRFQLHSQFPIIQIPK